MHLALAILLALHGAIHIFGFIKWLKLAPVPQLSGRTICSLSPNAERAFALLWLLVFLALIGAAALCLVRQGAWWLPAAVGIVLSQGLVVVAWHDAKFGTIANVLIFIPVLIASAHARFERRVDSEVRTLLARASQQTSVVERSELQRLPSPVRAWLEASGVVGRSRIRTVRLKQLGNLRTSPDSDWLPAEAHQYFSVEPPAFVWRVETQMMGFLPITGRDRYAEGQGEMLIKAGSFVNVANASDDKIGYGAMLRFLAEIMWFPSAALSPYLEWEPIDAARAKVTMRDGGKIVSAVITFNDQGRLLALHAKRYMGSGLDAKLTPWSGTCSEWRRFHGIEVPSRGKVTWELETGDFTYYQWNIIDVEYDGTKLYSTRDHAR